VAEQVAGFAGELAPRERASARAVSKPNKRGFWLTSLIVGASIFIWLSLIGSAVAGSVVAYELIDSGKKTYPASCYYQDSRCDTP
jgi:hypothetical protein